MIVAEAKASEEERVIGELNGQPVTYRRSVWFDEHCEPIARWRVADSIKCWKDGGWHIYPAMPPRTLQAIDDNFNLREMELAGLHSLDDTIRKSTPRIMAHISKPRMSPSP